MWTTSTGPPVLWLLVEASRWGLNKRPEGRRSQGRVPVLLAASFCGHLGLAASLNQRPQHLKVVLFAQYSLWAPVPAPFTASLRPRGGNTPGCCSVSCGFPMPCLYVSEQSHYKVSLNNPNPSLPSAFHRDLNLNSELWLFLWSHSTWLSLLQSESAFNTCKVLTTVQHTWQLLRNADLWLLFIMNPLRIRFLSLSHSHSFPLPLPSLLYCIE